MKPKINAKTCECCKQEQPKKIKKHICPLKEDVYHDSETLCRCCEECEHECAMDI